MTKDHIPLHIDPLRFTENGANLCGTLLVKDMQRLSPSLLTPEGDVKVNLSYGIDMQQIRFLQGSVEAGLTLQCQRCMKPFVYEIISEFTYGVVKTEENASELPKTYEPLLVSDGVINIPYIIEEELIVNLPIVSTHEQQDCKVKLPMVVVEDSYSPEEQKENPFNVIELLKVKSTTKQE